MFNNLVRNRKLALLVVIVLSLFLVVGCSSSDSEMSSAGESGALKVNVPRVKDDSGSSSLQTLVQENSEQVEVEITNQTDEQDQYSNNKQIKSSGTEVSFAKLEVGAKYEIAVKIKNKQGDVLYQTEKTSNAITDSSITEVEVDLSSEKIPTDQVNALAKSSNQAVIYYKKGFETPYIHYVLNGSWTDLPGEAMEDSQYDGYSVITIDLGDASELKAVFNDGSSNWDNNGGKNYTFAVGTSTFDDGNISEGAPQNGGMNYGDTTEPDPTQAELPNIPQDKVNQTMYQAFYWNMGNGLWTDLQSQADDFAEIGITSMWLPPATKAWGADGSVGYDVHDFWDLGEFDQSGSVATKYGTKAELENAISALHNEGIKAYADTVFNHRMGGDGTETVNGKEVWTDYYLNGRQKYYTADKYPNLYHDFDWNHYVFDSVDGELLPGKSWDVEEDYLMGADVDYDHTWVVDEMKAWGEWMIQDVGFDGFRLDAVKHVKSGFVGQWLDHVQYNTDKDVFTVGEVWIENIGGLEAYLDDVGNSDLKAFDFPLRNEFVELSSGDKDLGAWGAWNGLVHNRPEQAVTFVDNHDTCREGNPYDKPQVTNFKNQAYAYMLMRENGVPAVYARDYTEFNMAPALDQLVKARRYYAYGPGHEVDNNSHDVYSYVREGLDNVAGDGLVMMISDGTSGDVVTKSINARQANTTFYDITGNISGTVTTDTNGYADFKVTKSEGKGWSVWVPVLNE